MDFFKVLGAGAKFNKKYKPEKKEAKETKPEATNDSELDFFNDKPKPKILDTIQDANEWRKKNNIKVYGTDVPHPFKTFEELGERFQFKNYLQKNIASCYETPTPIQMQSLPIILHGRDLIACAPTGSGKTLAFLLPILHDLKAPTKEGFRAVIISPTRELATQKLIVGKPFKVCVLSKANTTSNLKNYVNALKQEVFKLDRLSFIDNRVRHLVLDEADKLLEAGFLEQVDDIFSACTASNLQISLFSATISSGVEELAKSFMKDPLRIVVGLKNSATDTINQKLLYVGQEQGKLVAVRQLVQSGLVPPCLIFVQSIERAKELFHELVYDGINVDVIHGERTKMQREMIVNNFRTGKIWVLIATELMARGIDFKGVNMVINYDFPQSVASTVDLNSRIGRTGRAGRKGEAITYFTKQDTPYLKMIVNVMKDSGCEVPDWMLELKNTSKALKQELKKGIKREQVKQVAKYDEVNQRKKREIIDASINRKKKQKTE
ncbi:DEAD (Asp-Glu-Ala-Asp) box polypeptide 52 [Boothiomyces macroporosus]|uniref:RNA helicase n=1 Tax=Boothiomyces macroporosus TaxID=261099 RepID=A0AAD5UK32_9FUNG|nr:DEAD (Asp-Glu-Ala-Asp) box polypeptide 52 [Boothiomyces macroporosus]